MPTKQEVGQRVRLARFRRNMTLKDVATKSGMSATHISEIERGKTSPTIGALQRIARALEERPAHFVEERKLCPASLVRRDKRSKRYACDDEGHTIDFELLTDSCPWGNLHITRKVSTPGEKYHRHPIQGEFVLMCVEGMFRVTVAGETHVLREGDTVQFFLDDGYLIENIGEEKGEVLGISAFDTRASW
jgi:transcriptional regulator with XRE-family HTH domain